MVLHMSVQTQVMVLQVDQVVEDGVHQLLLLMQVVLETHHQLLLRKVITEEQERLAILEGVVVVEVLKKQATQMGKVQVGMDWHRHTQEVQQLMLVAVAVVAQVRLAMEV